MLTTKSARILVICLAVLMLAFATIALFAPGSQVEAAVIKQGATGAQVRTIQTKLKNWGYYKGGVDGIFGSNTKSAVVYFQRRNGLGQDGIVGTATAKAMGITLSAGGSTGSSGGNSGSSNGKYSSSDIYLMSKCVYGEARGEGYTGKVAVAAVIINRVRSSKFPNTVSGVIYQKGAFTAVADGQINLGTNDECTRAVNEAIKGWDPSGGALYYFNPVTATSAWIWSRPQLITIGKHIFCA